MSVCTSCFVESASVPVEINNRPGLSAVVYRIGTFTLFRTALLDAISSTPELAGLRTRLSDDYSITVLELWSVVADILTFYQERIANEGYLRTATLRDSVLRLVRLIDYQLQPGLAATALLAFTLEKNASVAIPTRLRVQSVPAGAGSPQKYETIESINADARFNSLAILPAPELIAPLTAGRVSEFIAPGADMAAFASSLAPGDRLVAYDSSKLEFLTVASVTVNADHVSVQWVIPPSQDFGQAATGRTTDAGLFKIGRTFRLFGFDAPSTYIRTVLVAATDPQSLRAQLAITDPLSFDIRSFYLDARYQGIKPGSALLIHGKDRSDRVIYATVDTVSEGNATRGPRTGVTTLISAESPSGAIVLPTIHPPTVAPIAAVVSGTGLSGTYTFVVTFRSANEESNPGPPTIPHTVHHHDIHLSNIPISSYPNVISKSIYGFKNGVSSSYQFIKTIANGATSYSVVSDQPSWRGAPSTLAVTIYELIGPQLRLQSSAFPSRLSSPDLYLSGRRDGWSSIEVGRTIVKGVIRPGFTVELNDLVSGREIILVDSDPSTAVSAQIVATELTGDQMSLGVAGSDVQTLTQMGLDSERAQRITALVSPALLSTATHPAHIHMHNPRLEVEVTIGQHPPQTVTLTPAITISAPGKLVSVATIATALSAALQAVLPEVPEFSNAQTRDVADSVNNIDYLVIIPGTAGASVSFAPTASDPDTVVDLGLDGANVRYLDGVLSAPLNITTTGNGTLWVSLEMLPSQVVTFAMVAAPATPDTTVQNLSDAIQTQFQLDDPPVVFYLPSTGRMLSFPPPARFERASYLHITTTPGSPVNLDSSSALLLGNVAEASQGESVLNEIVGDGNASTPFQSFALRKSPVTFLLGNGPHGAQSSLAVSVNGVQWREVPTLYEAGPNDEVFVTRVADDMTLTMEFGDGITGSRLPTGLADVAATYRKGVGLAGAVGANTLTSLLDKANGLKRVTNPLAADGGADPQKLSDARTNAPVTVRTFGRAVSLLDFEDVALATGEIAKANATWVWTGLQKTIFLTVAAQNGDKLSSDGIHQLWSTLLSHRDPNHPLLISNFLRVPIVLTANLVVDPRYSASAVTSAAFSALVAALSFDQLQFGEAVHMSAMYGVLQDVAGVTAVDITDLNLKSQDPTFRKAHGADNRKPQPHLFMLGARPGTGSGVTVLPAELAWVDVPTQDLVLTATGGSGT